MFVFCTVLKDMSDYQLYYSQDMLCYGQGLHRHSIITDLASEANRSAQKRSHVPDVPAPPSTMRASCKSVMPKSCDESCD